MRTPNYLFTPVHILGCKTSRKVAGHRGLRRRLCLYAVRRGPDRCLLVVPWYIGSLFLARRDEEQGRCNRNVVLLDRNIAEAAERTADLPEAAQARVKHEEVKARGGGCLR